MADKIKYKVLIRVVKSLLNEWGFGSETVIRHDLIEAESKDEIKKMMAEQYPQFFPETKVYSRQTKDDAQFFYVLIYELDAYELRLIDEGSWTCDACGTVHPNKYLKNPFRNRRLFGEKMFCHKECESAHISVEFKNLKTGDEIGDNVYHIKQESPNYIYKITEKETGKCYIGKTRNEPVWRWWDHLKKSTSPFGIYLRSKPLNHWCFEVIDILPSTAKDSDVFELESRYIVEFDSINNGFNTTISNKAALPSSDEAQTSLEI